MGRRSPISIRPASSTLRSRFRRLGPVEALEDRQLLSATPLGLETRVNTQIVNSQGDASVAMDADGDYVVTWEGNGQDGSVYGVYAQRFNSAGVPQGAEFRANMYTQLNQGFPAAAMDADGDFVIVWQSDGQDGSDLGVYARRYDAAGVAQSDEFRVNTFTNDAQSAVSVAMDADGDFVVAWQSNTQDGSGLGVYARRYDSAGVAQGGAFRVNVVTTGAQAAPSVAMDSDGDFVVAWQSNGQDGSSQGVYARRYNAAGTAQGSEFRVNTHTAGAQFWPSVAIDPDGDFVVAWHSYNQDGSGYGIYAQRYNAAGAAQGSEFRVNTYTTDQQTKPHVAMDANGDFTIAWSSRGQDGSSYGVYAQCYSATGEPDGSEFRVNTYTTLNQEDPVVGMEANGDFVVVWHSVGQDGDGFGIYSQRYADVPVTPPSTVVDRRIFYNNSFYDGNNTGINAADAQAIDPTKSAYLPGSGAATFGNITGFSKGINGIMIDVDTIPNPAGIDAGDFVFRVGNNNTPGSWSAAPAPSNVMVATGAGTSGSDRITITWTDGAIQKQWLEVQVLSNTDTGLPDNFGDQGSGPVGDAFFFGSAVGGSGDGDSAMAAPTNASDEQGARNNPHGFGNFALVDDAYDYNKDRSVNATDQAISRDNTTGFGTQLIKINLGAAGPLAPQGNATPSTSVAAGDAGISSGLGSSYTKGDSMVTPSGNFEQRDRAGVKPRPVARLFEHLAETNTPSAKSTRMTTVTIGDDLALDDELLDSILGDLGL
jgi:hypothetical protein